MPRRHPIRGVPALGEDVVDVETVLEVDMHVDRVTGAEVARAALHLLGVEPLVSGTVAAAQREQPRSLELGLPNRTGLVATVDPRNDVLQVEGESGLGGAAVHLAKDPTPEP